MTQQNDYQPHYWAVVPAAGVGRRMGSDLPKQYLPLAGSSVLEQTLQRLLDHPRIAGLVVAISEGDPYWSGHTPHSHKPLLTASGGPERCHSVLNALDALAGHADQRDWVLVHDAARPCLRAGDIDRLLEQLTDHPVGGLLGCPVSDTLKRVDGGLGVEVTVDRSSLWRALTPQMFRIGALTRALRAALAKGALVTDDASAMELSGLKPLMVEGQSDNIKITHPQDLALAEFILQRQDNSE